MTSTRPLFQAFAAITLVMTLATCALPVGNSMTPTTSKTTTIGAGQARLVFQVGVARSVARALTDAGYLTVEMRSVADGTVKADDATREGDGSYLIDIAGLVAGDWRLKVRLYSDSLSPTLLYYADLTHYVGVGSPTSIALKVFEPSSLSSGTISLADKVEYLEVEGRGQPWGTSLNPLVPKASQTFRPGETVQIHAIPMTVPNDEDINPGMDANTIRDPLFDEQWFNYDHDGDTLEEPIENDEDWDPSWDDNTDQGIWARPATDARVTYTSDDPDVVEISPTGRLKARGIGSTTIHITTVEGRKTTSIPVQVEETIVGAWELGTPLSRVLKVERSPSGELWANLLTDLESGGMDPKVRRGRVLKQLDGSYKATLGQELGFAMVGADFDRTERVYVPASMPTDITFSEYGQGSIYVRIGNMMTPSPYNRQTNYVPVNRLDNLDSTAYSEPTTNDGWTVDTGRWVLENSTAGEPATYRQQYWWVEDSSVAAIDSKTGALTLTSSGSTVIHVQSLDNPSLPALSWNLDVVP